jgi:nucleoside-diphosphate-sugar epimerase
VRDFLYVEDACAGIIRSATSDADVLNLAGEHATIKELASRITQITHFQGKVQFNQRQFTGVQARILSTARAQSSLGSWSRRFSLTEGLRKTVQWYTKQISADPQHAEFAMSHG